MEANRNGPDLSLFEVDRAPPLAHINTVFPRREEGGGGGGGIREALNTGVIFFFGRGAWQ